MQIWHGGRYSEWVATGEEHRVDNNYGTRGGTRGSRINNDDDEDPYVTWGGNRDKSWHPGEEYSGTKRKYSKKKLRRAHWVLKELYSETRLDANGNPEAVEMNADDDEFTRGYIGMYWLSFETDDVVAANMPFSRENGRVGKAGYKRLHCFYGAQGSKRRYLNDRGRASSKTTEDWLARKVKRCEGRSSEWKENYRVDDDMVYSPADPDVSGDFPYNDIDTVKG